MQLFWTPASPFTRKVCVTARELGLWEGIQVRPTTWPLDWGYSTVDFTPGLAEANPVARIPTLITDEGVPLVESTTICVYLNARANGRSVIPSGNRQWSMWSLYGIADGILEAQIAMRAELLRPAQSRSQDFLVKQSDRLQRCFDVLEQRVDELEGDLDLAQITVAVACGYQDWREWLDDFRPNRPRLTAWYRDIVERDSLRQTAPSETPER
ncbi:MAG: glutathione S-transferase N-terminal domain-containing protein [Gammaproteobacteria bacterium]|nr:glutathione S-transferase N-terminal domain-containing protein [Gammaproteobacteria bacterium]